MRESLTFRAYLREKQRQVDLQRMGVLTASTDKKPKQPKWQVGEVNQNAWQENVIDNRYTGYSIGTLADMLQGLTSSIS